MVKIKNFCSEAILKKKSIDSELSRYLKNTYECGNKLSTARLLRFTLRRSQPSKQIKSEFNKIKLHGVRATGDIKWFSFQSAACRVA